MRQPAERRRTGATVVETAAVVVVFLLFLFGIMEYCRVIFVRQLIENASREGARYAVVNSNTSNVISNTKSRVSQVMAGMDSKVGNFTTTVFESDSSGNYVDDPSNASFGQYICVQIDCDYNPILPNFLFLGKNLHLVQRAIMYSEAN
jgi:Flp pilus assembly protein TadG